MNNQINQITKALIPEEITLKPEETIKNNNNEPLRTVIDATATPEKESALSREIVLGAPDSQPVEYETSLVPTELQDEAEYVDVDCDFMEMEISPDPNMIYITGREPIHIDSLRKDENGRPQFQYEDLAPVQNIVPRTQAELQYGVPVFDASTGARIVLGFNQAALAATYWADDQKGLVFYELGTGMYWAYDHGTGLWCELHKTEMRKDLGSFIKSRTPRSHWHKVNLSLIDSSLRHFDGIAAQKEPFNKTEAFIHVANGILELSSEGVDLRDAHPGDFSRNRTEIPYHPEAECPRFLKELLGSALPQDDIDLIQKYVGQCLIGRNLSQKLLMLRGTAGGGKSTLANVIDGVIGENNITELRTGHLNTRFELSRFIGKTLLVGRDVPGTFLNYQPAGVIKKLVGNDLLDAEKKSINGTFPIRGEFNMIITSNSRLHLKLDSDTEAWRRRLLIVDYERPKPPKVISEFDKLLLREEGPGILSWAVEGAVKLLQDLSEGDGQLKMSDAQKERVETLLNESDSVRAFITECIVADTASNVTVAELQDHYCSFCKKQGWMPKIQHTFSKESPNVIMEKFGRPLSNDIGRVGKNQRGYRYLKYVAPE